MPRRQRTTHERAGCLLEPQVLRVDNERVAHPLGTSSSKDSPRTGGPSSPQPLSWGKDGWPILYSFIVKDGVSRVPRDRCCFVLMPRRQRTTHERAGCLLEPQVLRVDNERVAHPLRLHRKGWGIARPARPLLLCPYASSPKNNPRTGGHSL
jgi:hypothetical protein